MITIIYDSNHQTVTAEGHALSAPAGEDLICCAVSTLMFTITAALTEAEVPFSIKLGNGYMYIKAEGKTARRIIEYISAGFKLISEKYPENVSFRIE